jgi:hypothetical protein
VLAVLLLLLLVVLLVVVLLLVELLLLWHPMHLQEALVVQVEVRHQVEAEAAPLSAKEVLHQPEQGLWMQGLAAAAAVAEHTMRCRLDHSLAAAAGSSCSRSHTALVQEEGTHSPGVHHSRMGSYHSQGQRRAETSCGIPAAHTAATGVRAAVASSCCWHRQIDSTHRREHTSIL